MENNCFRYPITAKSIGIEKRFQEATASALMYDKDHLEVIKKWMDKPRHFLLIHSPPGRGKSYICAAIANYTGNKFGFVRYFNGQRLVDSLRSCMDTTTDYSLHLKELLSQDWVILDDFGSGLKKDKETTDWKYEVLLSTIEHLYERRIPSLITTNFNKREAEIAFGERTASRLFSNENLILDFSRYPDLRELGY